MVNCIVKWWPSSLIKSTKVFSLSLSFTQYIALAASIEKNGSLQIMSKKSTNRVSLTQTVFSPIRPNNLSYVFPKIPSQKRIVFFIIMWVIKEARHNNVFNVDKGFWAPDKWHLRCQQIVCRWQMSLLANPIICLPSSKTSLAFSGNSLA